MTTPRYLLLLLAMMAIQGCASSPPPGVEAVVTLPTPAADRAGIYFYQDHTLLPAGEVQFVLNGRDLGGVRPGEWRYFEIEPGKYKYRIVAFPFFLSPMESEHQFRSGDAYFFEAAVINFTDQVFWIKREPAIAKTIRNITSGSYRKRLD